MKQSTGLFSGRGHVLTGVHAHGSSLLTTYPSQKEALSTHSVLGTGNRAGLKRTVKVLALGETAFQEGDSEQETKPKMNKAASDRGREP